MFGAVNAGFVRAEHYLILPADSANSAECGRSRSNRGGLDLFTVFSAQ